MLNGQAFCKRCHKKDWRTLTQVRYELDQLQKDLSGKLAERDEAHSERIKLMEQVFCFYNSYHKECVMDLDQGSETIIFGSLLTTFEASIIF